jgi:recombination associated protein RdgC
MLKNAFVYRIEHWAPPTLHVLEERLARGRFIACGAAQPESVGWLPPRGGEQAALAESVGGQVIFLLGTEVKAVPGGAVKAEVQRRLDALEKETGRRPKGKRARELKDAVVHELLPRAFPKRSDTLVWLDAQAQLVWVGAGTAKKADAVVSRLVELMAGGLKLAALQTALSPATAMAQWLLQQEPPAGFSIDRECELKQPDSEKAAVRYARHTLELPEIGAHIQAGKRPTRLALTWAGRVSFVLTDALVLKKIELLDVVLEGAAPEKSAAEDGGFDADVALSTGELRLMMPALVEALGGALEPGASPG